MIILSADESRELDRLSQTRYGVASYSLMTRAGEALAAEIERRWPEAARAGVLVVAGKGNNGGDGMVAGRKLLQDGAEVRVVLLARGEELKGDAARARSDFLALNGSIAEVSTEDELESAVGSRTGVVIDAVFGTGLNAEVRGLPRRAIESINTLGVPVVSVDIPSGINSDTGAVMGAAVQAWLTVTFGYAKFGHVSYPGAGLSGSLQVAEIGFAPQAIEEIRPRGRFLEAPDVRQLIRVRPANSHKGMYGHPLLVAGGWGKAGAALLAARGALRTGAGLVTAAVPEPVAAIVASGQAELMTEPIAARDGHFDARKAQEQLAELIAGKSAIMAGPGIGVSDDTRQLIWWLIAEAALPERPLLLDADGLNALAAIGCEKVRVARGPVVLTPHPGEMARLLGVTTSVVNADRISAALRLVESTGAFVLLKGARSVIAGPGEEVHVNSTGNPGMATPGMGDALSGMLATLLAQGMRPIEALMLGTFVHGESADRVARRVGSVGYLTGDVIEEIPRTLEALRG